MLRALALHQCDPWSNLGVDSICGLSLFLVLFLTPRGFSPGTPVLPSPPKQILPNSNSNTLQDSYNYNKYRTASHFLLRY